MIYFDHNATTALDERVLAAMQPFFSSFYGNPSSLHKLGRLSRSAIDSAREQVAALVGVSAAQVIFTSGGTEANALALNTDNCDTHLLISAIEHPAVSEVAAHWRRLGRAVDLVRVDSNGIIIPEALDELTFNAPTVVSLMLANNETGAIQPIAACAAKLADRGAILHTDAVQAAGKIPLDFNQLGVQRMSLSSHKIYGPKGCGALIISKNDSLTPLLAGGGQEFNYRSGTENVPAIVGFGKAAELALAELNTRAAKLLQLRSKLEQGLSRIPGLTIFAASVERLPNTVLFAIAGLDGEMLLMQLDQKNIAVSSGSACAAGAAEPSPVLTAMGVSADLAKAAIRVSLGIHNTEAEIAEFIHVLTSLLPIH